jgi:hypothetical protein
MARRNSIATPSNNHTRGEDTIQEFANSNLTPEESRRRAARWLNSRALLQDIRELASEDQTKFVEKVDQVCRDSSSSPQALEIISPLSL